MVNVQPQLTIHWRGHIPLEHVSWKRHTGREVVLKPELEAKRNRVWKKTVRQHPSVYDGLLLVLERLQASSTGVHLDLNTVRFSRVVTLDSLGLGLVGYGCLGCQMIILTPDRQSILIGERARVSIHCPLFLSVPGGMLESGDAEGSVEKACMRELNEEALVDVGPEKHLLAIVGELHGKLGAIMLVEMVAQETPIPGALVSGNEEWTSSQLRWYSVDELDRLDLSRTLEGVAFVAEEWRIHHESRRSVIWP